MNPSTVKLEKQKYITKTICIALAKIVTLPSKKVYMEDKDNISEFKADKQNPICQ